MYDEEIEQLRKGYRDAGLSESVVASFQALVLDNYETEGRVLPWRETREPYHIVLSEVMLQQTQVQRVLVKYHEFLELFPTVTSLAQASLEHVLLAWQGLGYNRRAVALKRCAERVIDEFAGNFPTSVPLLESLPGIGTYTSRAIAVFAFDQPAVFIETNIRTVFLHCFFPGSEGVHDREIMPLVSACLPRENHRDWYYALMDFGVMIKKHHGNASRQSQHHVRQSPFHGSNRQLRSQILRVILSNPGMDRDEISAMVKAPLEKVADNLRALVAEGFVSLRNKHYTVA